MQPTGTDPIVPGTALGMLLAHTPVAFHGIALARRLPERVACGLAAALFAVRGVGVLAIT